MSPPQLAVVTVTHNSSQVIEGWIDALEETGARSRMEVCVVTRSLAFKTSPMFVGPEAPDVNSSLDRTTCRDTA